MGLLTTFLSLFKPDYTDEVDIADINSNMDKIDARLKGIDDGTFSVGKANQLSTARKINGVNFNGESDITITAAANGGTSAACSGNAASATKLATARTINGVSFNGTANITVTDSTKAPTSHASTGTGYGVGTTANYGHVKTINGLTQASHANGTALSAYQGKVLDDKINEYSKYTLIRTVSIAISGAGGIQSVPLLKADFNGNYDFLFVVRGTVAATTTSSSNRSIRIGPATVATSTTVNHVGFSRNVSSSNPLPSTSFETSLFLWKESAESIKDSWYSIDINDIHFKVVKETAISTSSGTVYCDVYRRRVR